LRKVTANFWAFPYPRPIKNTHTHTYSTSKIQRTVDIEIPKAAA
jgi:hypothetical protein